MMIRTGNHEDLAAAIRDMVPAQPGVYLFKDKTGDVIYVGKSVNLRSRMLSYFRQRHDTVESRIGLMIHGIEAFDYRVTQTELQALLIEDELIKQELPRYNVRQKEFDEYRYLLLTRDPFPALKTIEHRAPDNQGTLFGPYKDKYFTARLLDLVCRCFRFRACTDPVPCEKCMSYDIGDCAGPCRDVISAEDYAAITAQVSNFLNGDDTIATRTIERELEAAASSRRYEKAAVLRDQLEFCQRFCARQRFIHKFKSGLLVVSERDVEHRFDRGRWIAGRSTAAAPDTGIDAAADSRFTADRANIVYTWLKKNDSGCEHRFL